MALVPVTQFASFAAQGIFLLGFVMGNFAMFAGIAVLIFTIIWLFQVITLPVEYDASRRAKERLFQLGVIQGQERPAVNSVLNAAALTYVAAMVTALFHVLYFLMLARGHRDE
jgi:Zn-dependent membrane protease YugP